MAATERRVKQEQVSGNGHLPDPTYREDAPLHPHLNEFLDKALAIVNAEPKPRDDAELQQRLTALKQLVQASGIKADRRYRRGLGGDLLVLTLSTPGVSEHSKKLMHEIMDMLTPERIRQPNHSLDDYTLPGLTVTEEEMKEITALEERMEGETC